MSSEILPELQGLAFPEFTSAEDGVIHFFGTREGPKQWTRDEDLGLVQQGPTGHSLVVAARQVHGIDVFVVDHTLQVGDELPGGWDALISDRPDVLLTVRTADCVPVLIHDAARGVIGAVHAGWRGTVNEILPATIRTMSEKFASVPSDLNIAIGPSAGSCCYEVDDVVIHPLRQRCSGWHTVLEWTGEARGKLNLKRLIRHQAEACGIPGVNIHESDLCTICSPDLFYSYRREGESRGTMVSGVMRMGSSNP